MAPTAFYLRHWRQLYTSISIYGLATLSFYFVLPESPRWLMAKGRIEEAEKVVRWMAKCEKNRLIFFKKC